MMDSPSRRRHEKHRLSLAGAFCYTGTTMNKHFFLPLCLLALVGFGCQNAVNPESNTADQTTPTTVVPVAPAPTVTKPTPLKSTVYTSFVINVHDWTEPAQSIATVNRLIDLHEQYKVPVDLYLDDGVDQIFEQQAPELFMRLESSPYVAVSYHIRPPTPYYGIFHSEYFDEMSHDQLIASLTDYETHAIDFVTGKTTSAPGGYQHLKELIGYAPYVVAYADGKSSVSKALAEVYKGMGAQFVLHHGDATSFGSTINGLYLRPEDEEFKVYEHNKPITSDEIFSTINAGLPATRPAFLNLKWHENNFYSSGTGWAGIYYEPNGKDVKPLSPPYDLSLASTTQSDKTDAQEKIQWDRYEGMLQYVLAHSDTYTVINARDVAAMIAAQK